jgi:hypothetical protein
MRAARSVKCRSSSRDGCLLRRFLYDLKGAGFYACKISDKQPDDITTHLEEYHI